jgi:hypothetical protein
VARLLGDVAVLEEPVLANPRVELGLHAGVVEVLGPRDERVDRSLRAVAVVDLEREPSAVTCSWTRASASAA